MERHAHWDRVFEDRSLTAVSWYEQSPRMSLEMIDLAGIEPHEAVLDVGGGASPFAGALLARGFADVTVLDLSEVAVRASRAELGPAAARVAWIRADILDWTPERTYGLWHDRAAFHFLVEVESRERYLVTARSAVRPGGHAVIGTFAEDGPTTCSGLPVARYDAEALADAFGPEFTTVGPAAMSTAPLGERTKPLPGWRCDGEARENLRTPAGRLTHKPGDGGGGDLRFGSLSTGIRWPSRRARTGRRVHPPPRGRPQASSG